jgi:hypothetical protein
MDSILNLFDHENSPDDLEILMRISDELQSIRKNELSLLIAEYLLNIGSSEHLTISAFERIRTLGYHSKSPRRRKMAALIADRMCYDRRIKNHLHYRKEFHWYRKSILEICDDSRIIPVDFSPPTINLPCNPSIHRHQDELRMSIRTVNYDNDGRVFDGTHKYMTRNWIVTLDENLGVVSSGELLPHPDMKPGTFYGSTGFEDLRLFTWRNDLWCSFSSWDFDETPHCRMVKGRITDNPDGGFFLSEHQVMIPRDVPPHMYEKNWMPFVKDDRLRFVHSSDPVRVLDDQYRTIMQYEPSIAAENFRGGSQMIQFDGGWLAVVHETYRDGPGLYVHRFVWFDSDLILRKCSQSFYFIEPTVEFVAGIEYSLDRSSFIISFGYKDKKAFMAVVPIKSLDQILLSV